MADKTTLRDKVRPFVKTQFQTIDNSFGISNEQFINSLEFTFSLYSQILESGDIDKYGAVAMLFYVPDNYKTSYRDISDGVDRYVSRILETLKSGASLQYDKELVLVQCIVEITKATLLKQFNTTEFIKEQAKYPALRSSIYRSDLQNLFTNLDLLYAVSEPSISVSSSIGKSHK